MGLKDIFRKEAKFLDSPKELPNLASEELNDEQRRDFVENNSKKTEDIPAPVPPSPQTLESAAIAENKSFSKPEVSEQSINRTRNDNNEEAFSSNLQNNNQLVSNNMPLQHPMNHNFMNNPYFFNQPIHYPVNYYSQNPAFYPSVMNPRNLNEFDVQRVMSSTNHDLVSSSERGPLRKLLFELDKLETRWHVLSNQKSSLEKELKYLESEIEHKMKLLRTHLAIANESNLVNEGDEFHMCDGQVLSSRADLEAAASRMTKQVFDHHVGPGWNDFESWTANCLHDYSLAKRLKNIKSVFELQTALKKY